MPDSKEQVVLRFARGGGSIRTTEAHLQDALGDNALTAQLSLQDRLKELGRDVRIKGIDTSTEGGARTKTLNMQHWTPSSQDVDAFEKTARVLHPSINPDPKIRGMTDRLAVERDRPRPLESDDQEDVRAYCMAILQGVNIRGLVLDNILASAHPTLVRKVNGAVVDGSEMVQPLSLADAIEAACPVAEHSDDWVESVKLLQYFISRVMELFSRVVPKEHRSPENCLTGEEKESPWEVFLTHHPADFWGRSEFRLRGYHGRLPGHPDLLDEPRVDMILRYDSRATEKYSFLVREREGLGTVLLTASGNLEANGRFRARISAPPRRRRRKSSPQETQLRHSPEDAFRYEKALCVALANTLRPFLRGTEKSGNQQVVLGFEGPWNPPHRPQIGVPPPDRPSGKATVNYAVRFVQFDVTSLVGRLSSPEERRDRSLSPHARRDRSRSPHGR